MLSHRTSVGSLPVGSRDLKATVGGEEMTVFTYRPHAAPCNGVLMLFDGLNRDASGMRDKAINLAERTALVTLSPLMDRVQFPKWRYNAAGVVRRNQAQPRERWTGPLLRELCEWAHAQTGQAATRIFLFGHSAGGQLLSRICAYSPLSGTCRIVIANPSAYVAPSLEEPAPFGFAHMFSSTEMVARLQVYLALPITIYLGQEDTGTRNLSTSRAACRQGLNRLARGRAIYKAGGDLARRQGWAFNWKLVEVPNTGHSAREMLDAHESMEALGISITP